jgi:hypothetical protein
MMEERKFINDNDTVIMKGFKTQVRIGFESIQQATPHLLETKYIKIKAHFDRNGPLL